MKLMDILALKLKEEEAARTVMEALTQVTDNLHVFVQGFNIPGEIHWARRLARVLPHAQDPRSLSIVPEQGGLQMEILFEVKQETDKKPGVVRASILHGDDGKTYLRVHSNVKGNPKIDELFYSRYVEYLEGELEILGAEIILPKAKAEAAAAK